MTGSSINPAVSLVIIYCKGREKQFEQTLLSVERQKYSGPLEIIVTEDGDDGGTCKRLCTQFGARHIQCRRVNSPVDSGRWQYWTANPPFGNLPILRNKGIVASTHGIIIFQDAEVSHDNDVILELANRVQNDSKLMVSTSMKRQHENSVDWHWDRHPSLNEPNGCSLSSVNAIQRQTLLHMGGFEESFTGYGHDDDHFFYVARKHIKIEYSRDASATHQFHYGIPFDYPTARASRAIYFRLRHEIERGLRPPIANYKSSEVLDATFPEMSRELLKPIVQRASDACSIKEFRTWVDSWFANVEDEHGDVAREMEEWLIKRERETGLDLTIPWAAASAAFMVRCAENANSCGAVSFVKPLLDWARTAATIVQRGERCGARL